MSVNCRCAVAVRCRDEDPNEAEEHFGAHYWRFTLPGREYGFHRVLIDYMAEKKIDMQKVFVVLDFSDF